MSQNDYIDGMIEVKIDGWPDQHDPGINIQGAHIAFMHIGPTKKSKHLYYFRTNKENIHLLIHGNNIESHFIGNYSTLASSNHEFRKFAFYANVERRNASGGVSQISVPMAGLQHGDKISGGLRPRIVFAGDTGIPDLGNFEEILSTLGISYNNSSVKEHIFEQITYYVVSGISPRLSADAPIGMSPNIFWVPASRLPDEVAAFWEPGGQGELTLSGAFAVDASKIAESHSIEGSKKYTEIKRAISQYLSACAIMTDLTPILAFTWSTYIQPGGQRVQSMTFDSQIFDYRIYGIKRYPSNFIEISDDIREKMSIIIGLNREIKANRPILGFLRGLDSALRAADPVVGFPTLWAAMESILRPGTGEITYKLAVSLAELCGGNAKTETYRNVKEGYKLRSDIVHGNNFNEDYISKFGAFALCYCRIILKKLLEDSFSDEGIRSLSVDALVEKLLTGNP